MIKPMPEEEITELILKVNEARISLATELQQRKVFNFSTPLTPERLKLITTLEQQCRLLSCMRNNLQEAQKSSKSRFIQKLYKDTTEE